MTDLLQDGQEVLVGTGGCSDGQMRREALDEHRHIAVPLLLQARVPPAPRLYSYGLV